jgi:hypothetical protein
VSLFLIGLAVGALDAFVTYFVIKEREAWIAGSVMRSVLFDGLVTAAIGVSICVFVAFSWAMILPSVVGSMFGRWLAWKL